MTVRPAESGDVRPHGTEIGTFHIEMPGRFLLGSPRERIKSPGFLDADEPEVRQELNEFCRLQSTSNSAGPEVDITPALFVQLRAHDDISQVQAAARLQDALDFREGPHFVGHQIEYSVGKDNIHAGILYRK